MLRRAGIAVVKTAVLLMTACFVLLNLSIHLFRPPELPELEPLAHEAGIAAIPLRFPPAAEPEEIPEPEPEFFVITMIGDCTLGAEHYSKGGAWSYERVVGDDYAYPFAETRHVFEGSDFTIANLECALTDYDVHSARTFNFRARPEAAQILSEGGVHFVSLANNHAIDYGDIGYDDTKAALDDAGISYVCRDEGVLYTTGSGLTIGIYGASFSYTHLIEAGIKDLREQGAEFVIAALHWGVEGWYKSSDIQRPQGRAAIDAGADIVMGTHPHTLQEIEAYHGGYIYYSLGNFTFGCNSNPRDKDAVIVRLTVMRDVDGAVSLVDTELIPIAVSGNPNANNYQPVLYEAGSAEYERVLSKLDGSFSGPGLSIEYSYP